MAALSLCVCLNASALDGGSYSAFTPYSVYGLGEQFNPGTAYNWTMGGVGIASRNIRYLNITNPAAVTARDSLAFMSDFSVCEGNKIYRQGSLRSAENTFNMLDFAISFPITDHTAMALGIKPFSASGYGYADYPYNAAVLSEIGNVVDSYYGQGSVYELFASYGAVLFKRLSLGVEAIHYFGEIEKSHARAYSESAALSYTQSSELQIKATAYKAGIQYEQPIGKKLKIGFGATYRTSADLGGRIYDNTTSGSAALQADTIALGGGPKIASEMAFGVSFNYMEKLRGEFDYSRSNWTDCGFDGYAGLRGNADVFSGRVSEAYRVGFEYIPNLADIRYYWKKIAYRAGAYYKTESYNCSGLAVSTSAVTLGVTLPVFRWYNGLTLGMEVGRRGTLSADLVRETFVNFSLGVNLFDIWFQQRRYE